MIRTLTHRLIDLVFDVVAEVGATLFDALCLSGQLLKRARSRWSQRRAVPGWDTLLPVTAGESAHVDYVGEPTVEIDLAAFRDEEPAGEPAFFDAVLREEPALAR